MPFELHIVDGPNTGRRIPVGTHEVTVGRTNQATQSIASDSVMSSVHFKIWIADPGCQVQDLNSTNGTFVNGERVNKASLDEGDMITAGSTTFEVRFTEIEARPVQHTDVTTPPEPPSPPAAAHGDPTARRQPDGHSPGVNTPDRGATNSHDATNSSVTGSIVDTLRVEIRNSAGFQAIYLPSDNSVTFGRTARANVVVDDEMISGLHFSLEYTNAGVMLTDLGSRNGTFAGERRVGQCLLKPGDQFAAGRTTFLIVSKDGQSNDDETVGEDAPPVSSTLAEQSQQLKSSEPASVPRDLATSPIESSELASDVTDENTIEAAEENSEQIDEPVSAIDPLLGDEAPLDQTPSPAVAELERQVRKPPQPEIEPEIEIERPIDKLIVTDIRSKWPYDVGLTDTDPRVRSSCLLAALFNREPWLLQQCRAAASVGNPLHIIELRLLSILGDESDLPTFLELIDNAAQHGPVRLRCVGSFGHPDVISTLIPLIDASDRMQSAEACRAFEKIVGQRASSSSAAEEVYNESGIVELGSPKVWHGHPILDGEQKMSEEPRSMESRLELQLRRVSLGQAVGTASLFDAALDYLVEDIEVIDA